MTTGSGSSNGGGQVSNTVQKADPWSGQQPYLTSGFQAVGKDFFGQTNPDGTPVSSSFGQGAYNPQYYQGSTVAPMSGQTQDALNMMQQTALSGNQPVTAANSFLTNQINSNSGQANPQFAAMMQNVNNAVTPAMASNFEANGRYGSGAQAKATADALSQAGTNAAYTDYQTNIGNQLKAAYQAPQAASAAYAPAQAMAQVGQTQDSYNQSLVNDAVNRWNFQQNQPVNMANQYMGLVQGNYGGSQSTSSSVPQYASNPWGNALTGAAVGGGLGYLGASAAGASNPMTYAMMGAGGGGLVGGLA